MLPCHGVMHVGGTEESYRSSSHDIYLQSASGAQKQNIEFHFCQPVGVTLAKFHAPHGGHTLQRATLQYRSSGAWHTVSAGSNTGLTWEMPGSTTACSTRWRIADWRCASNQWLDGVDLTVKACSDCTPSPTASPTPPPTPAPTTESPTRSPTTLSPTASPTNPQCVSGTATDHTNFVYSSEQPSGWTYKRLKSESENYLTDSEVGTSCQSWAYVDPPLG